MSNYALRIPDSLFEFAKKCAKDDNVSLNQFIVLCWPSRRRSQH